MKFWNINICILFCFCYSILVCRISAKYSNDFVNEDHSIKQNRLLFDSNDIDPSEWICAGNLNIQFYTGLNIDCGTEVIQDVSQTRPTYIYPSADPLFQYSLIVVDRDATSADNPSLSPYRHFAIVNISGSDLLIGNLDGKYADALFPYAGPQPPAGSGLHRYYSELYVQTPNIVPG